MLPQSHDLYLSAARNKALTRSNALAAWEACGLWPLNPPRVLTNIEKPRLVPKHVAVSNVSDPQRTPATTKGFVELRRLIEGESHILSEPCKYRMRKAFNAAEKALPDRGLLLDENRLLFQQNCERTRRKAQRSQPSTRQASSPPVEGSFSLRTTEIEKGRREIRTFDFSSYCHILDI